MFVNHPILASLRLALVGAAFLLLVLAAGCSYSHGDPAPTCDVPNETVTYDAVIAPIFAANCLRCHGSSVAAALGGGNDFSTYTAVSRYPQNNLLGCIRQDPSYPAMPKDGGKLSDCDIQRIAAWYTKGTPR